MSLKGRIYQVLVNRHIGIAERYHMAHDNAHGMARVLSWGKLLWWNFAYYVLFCRFLGEKRSAAIYEEKHLDITRPESASTGALSVDELVEKLSGYDVISFDIFDTLIFRPFSAPTDLFYLLGARLEYMNFHDARIAAEYECRQEQHRRHGTYEVTLREIWDRLQEDTGLPAQEGCALEEETELALCYANPIMLEVFTRLQERGKRVVVTSDMYLSHDFLSRLLVKNGFAGFEQLFVSCEYGYSKANGRLYETLKHSLPAGLHVIHVGDNTHSDVEMAKRAGFATYHYPNVNRFAFARRAFDMSVLIGGAYRGIVDNHLYCGRAYSMEYEYGFVYGGLFVLGYCRFIHDYCKQNAVDKILFLSRDGDILQKAYDYLYPDENTAYAYWSRRAATKLAAVYDKQDWFRRFLFHKVNQGYRIQNILHAMELDFLTADMKEWNLQAELTDQNASELKAFLEQHWEEVLAAYEPQHVAARKYYANLVEENPCRKVAAVDIGWAGSGAMVLRKLFTDVWHLNCEVVGLIAGTNTIYNAQPDASETFLQTGALAAYLYSQQHNRDLWKKHDPNRDYNVYWELLLSSPTRQFQGFYTDERDVYLESLDISLGFGTFDENLDGIREIQRGVMDFVKEYHMHFADYPYMFRISGRDVYAPMLVAASEQERYLKAIKERFALEIQI